MAESPRLTRLAAGLAALATLAAVAGCDALGPALLAGQGAATDSSEQRDPRAASAGDRGGALPGQGAAVHTVLGPDGRPAALPPGSGLHVLAAGGDAAATGTLTGTGSVPLEDVVLYLTDPQERYYVVQSAADPALAALIAPTSRSDGTWTTPGVLPPGLPVLAKALLPGNRRLAGFGRAGDAAIRVSPGSTVAVEFLRDQLGAGFPGALGETPWQDLLIAQGARADALFAAGTLGALEDGPDGDLVAGNGARLASRYVADGFARDRETFDAWNALLSPHVLALTTFAGNFRLRYNDGDGALATALGLGVPSGVAAGGPGDEGTVYIAEEYNHRLKRVRDGLVTLVAGRTAGDPSLVEEAVAEDGSAVEPDMPLATIQEIRADPSGNLAMTFGNFDVVGYLCFQAGRHFGRDMAAGAFYRLGAPDGDGGLVDGARETARFRSPLGLSFDDAGNLYVCDRRNNRIRRIDAATGEVRTVLGDGWPWLDAIGAATGDLPDPVLTLDQAGASGSDEVYVTDFGRLLDQPAAPGSGLAASFSRPAALAWRRAGATQELYVYDTYNNAIRQATAPYPGDFADAAVRTVAGTVVDYEHAEAGYTVRVGLRGPASDGPADAVTFSLAAYDPGDPDVATFAHGSLALDAERGLLFIGDNGNAAIRVLDLATRQVRTVASADPTFREGDARRVLLSNDLGAMAVLGDHGLVFTDRALHVVRKLHLQFGM